MTLLNGMTQSAACWAVGYGPWRAFTGLTVAMHAASTNLITSKENTQLCSIQFYCQVAKKDEELVLTKGGTCVNHDCHNYQDHLSDTNTGNVISGPSK